MLKIHISDIESYDVKPRHAPTELDTSWPRPIDSKAEEEFFRASMHEYLDDEFGEQPVTFKWAVAP